MSHHYETVVTNVFGDTKQLLVDDDMEVVLKPRSETVKAITEIVRQIKEREQAQLKEH